MPSGDAFPSLKWFGSASCQVRDEQEGTQRHGSHGYSRIGKGGQNGPSYGNGISPMHGPLAIKAA